MIEKIKTYSMIATPLLVVALFLLMFNKCESDKSHAIEIKKLDQNITALNDSITKTVNKKGDTVYVEKTVQMSLDELMQTAAFKQLSKEKQAYYKDLQQTKGLLAASRETIEKQGEIIAALTDTVGVYTDTTVCYKYGDKIDIPDTTVQKLTYHGDITFERERVKLAIKYDYKIKIDSKIVEYKKDGSVVIQHSIDDPNAKITEGDSYIAPPKQKTFWQKVWTVTKDVLKIGGGFGSGYVVGRVQGALHK